MRFQILIALLLALLPSCDHRTERRGRFDAGEWLSVAFGRPLPANAHVAHGIGDCWDADFNCYFHLSCTAAELLPFLEKNGFKETEIYLEEIRLNLPPGMKSYFTQEWHPKWTSQSKMYLREFDGTCSTAVMLNLATGEAYVNSTGHRKLIAGN